MSIAQGCNDILDFLWRQRDLTIFLVRLMFVDANQGLLCLLCWCILWLFTWCLRHSLQPWWMIGWHVGVSFCPTSAARENTKLHRSSIETKTCSALLEQCGPTFSEGGWECVAGHESWDGGAHWSSMSSMLSLSVVLFFVRFFLPHHSGMTKVASLCLQIMLKGAYSGQQCGTPMAEPFKQLVHGSWSLRETCQPRPRPSALLQSVAEEQQRIQQAGILCESNWNILFFMPS